MEIYWNKNKEYFSKFMDQMHKDIEAKLNLKEAAEKYQNNADKLTKYFQQLKKPTKDSFLSEKLDQQWEEIAKDTFMLQNKFRAGQNQLKNASRLFRRTHKSTTSITDDIFEEELSSALQAIFNKAIANKSIEIGSNFSIVGSDSFNIAEEIVGDQHVIEVLNHMRQKVGKRLIDDTLTDDTAPYYRPVSRPGKTDVKGLTTEINIETDIKPEWQEFFELLKDATFSAKNYASGHIDKNTGDFIKTSHPYISLGSSDPYKAFAGVLSYVGYDLDDINSYFVNLYWKYEKTTNSSIKNEVAKHIYHIRFIYELTGAGLQRDKTKEYAKYLIYNDPATDYIQVVSTDKLIYDLFNSINETVIKSPFQEIRLHQNKLRLN